MDAPYTQLAVSSETAIAAVVVCGLIASLVTVAQIIASPSKSGNARFWGGL